MDTTTKKLFVEVLTEVLDGSLWFAEDLATKTGMSLEEAKAVLSRREKLAAGDTNYWA